MAHCSYNGPAGNKPDKKPTDVFNLKHIKYRLWKEKDVVYFQILSMDERFRCRDHVMDFKISHRLQVVSNRRPQLIEDGKLTIFLRGADKWADSQIESWGPISSSVYDVSSVMRKIHQALKAWDKKWFAANHGVDCFPLLEALLKDAEKVQVTWGHDEQQADPVQRNWKWAKAKDELKRLLALKKTK